MAISIETSQVNESTGMTWRFCFVRSFFWCGVVEYWTLLVCITKNSVVVVHFENGLHVKYMFMIVYDGNNNNCFDFYCRPVERVKCLFPKRKLIEALRIKKPHYIVQWTCILMQVTKNESWTCVAPISGSSISCGFLKTVICGICNAYFIANIHNYALS